MSDGIARGTRVTVRLPRVLEAAAAPSRAPVTRNGRSMRVLVVAVLKGNNHEVVFCDLAHGARAPRRIPGRDYSGGLAVSPDGGLVASSTYGGLVRLFEQSPSPQGRVHALWTLEGIGKLEPEAIRKALADILAQYPQVMDALIDTAFIGALPGPEKRGFGQKMNEVKNAITAAFDAKKSAAEAAGCYAPWPSTRTCWASVSMRILPWSSRATRRRRSAETGRTAPPAAAGAWFAPRTAPSGTPSRR